MRVSRRWVEEARARLIELVPEGFEEVELRDAVELAAYTDGAGETRLRQAFGAVVARPVERGWEEAWKRFHRPVRVGRVWVGPTWERPDDDSVAVVIDPGRAFGTGAHPTTRLCLELLLTCEPGSLVDLGCGSGVLAIAAAKLGFAPVYALDIDAAAVAATRRNVEANGVAVETRACDVLSTPLPRTDVAVANVAREVVERVAERLSSRELIASGYPASEAPSLAGWAHVERRESDGWAADAFRRPASDSAHRTLVRTIEIAGSDPPAGVG